MGCCRDDKLLSAKHKQEMASLNRCSSKRTHKVISNWDDYTLETRLLLFLLSKVPFLCLVVCVNLLFCSPHSNPLPPENKWNRALLLNPCSNLEVELATSAAVAHRPRRSWPLHSGSLITALAPGQHGSATHRLALQQAINEYEEVQVAGLSVWFRQWQIVPRVKGVGRGYTMCSPFLLFFVVAYPALQIHRSKSPVFLGWNELFCLVCIHLTYAFWHYGNKL